MKEDTSASYATLSHHTKRAWWIGLSPRKTWLHRQRYWIAKRVMDLGLVLGSLPLWLPLFCLCAMLIKLTSPRSAIFFIQARTGQGGRRFGIYKFRTMVPNAEEVKRQLMHLNELSWPDFKITNDPRITRVGRLLRVTSLDELPQLLNVLQGHMSLVGPRPTSFSADTYDLWHTERLDVIPGITGLWQLYGRGTAEFDSRLRLDIAYIERRCLRLDLGILIRTIACVLRRRGAF